MVVEMVEKVEINDCVMYLGDCEEVLDGLGMITAIVTDPPYGIGAAKSKAHSRIRDRDSWPNTDWDDNPPSPGLIRRLLAFNVPSIIFGGNYFTLPPSRCWLIWDKMNPPGFSLADAELAWTNLDKAVRKWTGRAPCQGQGKIHPTEKPLGLMQWAIERLPKGCHTILDPFMGSATTGVACVKASRRFIGIERERRYFDLACERIEQVNAQHSLLPAA